MYDNDIKIRSYLSQSVVLLGCLRENHNRNWNPGIQWWCKPWVSGSACPSQTNIDRFIIIVSGWIWTMGNLNLLQSPFSIDFGDLWLSKSNFTMTFPCGNCSKPSPSRGPRSRWTAKACSDVVQQSMYMCIVYARIILVSGLIPSEKY